MTPQQMQPQLPPQVAGWMESLKESLKAEIQQEMEAKYQKQLERLEQKLQKASQKASRWEQEVEPLIVDPKDKRSTILVRLDNPDFNNQLRVLLGNQQPRIYPNAFRSFRENASVTRYQHDPVRLFIPQLLRLIVDHPLVLQQIISYSDSYRSYFEDIDWEETVTNRAAAAAAATEPMLEDYEGPQ